MSIYLPPKQVLGKRIDFISSGQDIKKFDNISAYFEIQKLDYNARITAGASRPENIAFNISHGHAYTQILQLYAYPHYELPQRNFEKHYIDILANNKDFILSGQNILNFRTNMSAYYEIKRLYILSMLQNRHDFNGNIYDYQTINKAYKEINRLDMVKILLMLPEFITSNQDINDFNSWQKAYNEYKRITMIVLLANNQRFIESGKSILDFQRPNQAYEELIRIDMIKTLEKRPDFNGIRFQLNENTQSIKSIQKEILRLDAIEILKYLPAFIETKQDIKKFQTYEAATYEAARLGWINLL